MSAGAELSDSSVLLPDGSGAVFVWKAWFSVGRRRRSELSPLYSIQTAESGARVSEP